ncbi:MAG: hypothetical protein Q9208_005532 [Pyrenodesmia sp. 3 TL-2023]
MSSTTEHPDWEANIIPRARQPSNIPKIQPQIPPQQPVFQRAHGPGQSVFPVAARGNFRLQNSQSQIPLPQPQFPFVNPYPLPAPSFAAPIPMNPALARVIHETPQRLPPPSIQNPPPTPITTTGTPATPLVPNPPTHLTPAQVPNPVAELTPDEYVTPPSRSIRGVKRGATRGRGGRKPKIKVETPDAGDTPITTSKPASGRGSGRARARGGRVNRGGRPRGSRAGASSARGVKRKRDDDDEKENDSDVSEIITPLPTQSRSGRKITHASTFSPIVIDLEEKKPQSSLSVPAAKPAATAATIEPARGRGGKRYSRPGEASVCKNCGRGHSPASNMIVFCDGCNGPWHQYCHDPPISSEVIRIEEQEWFCSDCLVLREEKAHVEGKVSAETLSVVEVSLQTLYCSAVEQQLSIYQKRRYLQSLPSAQLVSLLLHATILHPDLPIFATASGGPLPEKARKPITHFVDPTAPPEEDDESYDLYPDSEVLPYPKAGNGVSFQRESDFLSMLIDEDVGVYSHVWDWKRRGLNFNDAVD